MEDQNKKSSASEKKTAGHVYNHLSMSGTHILTNFRDVLC
jgi:hypothetical protein